MPTFRLIRSGITSAVQAHLGIWENAGQLTCHNCRIDCQKFGKHRNGLRRFRCNTCGRTYTEPHETESAARRP